MIERFDICVVVVGLRIQCLRAWEFKSPLSHQIENRGLSRKDRKEEAPFPQSNGVKHNSMQIN